MQGNPARKGPNVFGQSAMEYLMTYGWAILIIAVILGVLFSLGVFNPINYAPKVPTGNCHVFRPNGPGTNFNVALVGTCSGLLPQYVAQFSAGNYINTAAQSSALTQFTFLGWFYVSQPTSIGAIRQSACGMYVKSVGDIGFDTCDCKYVSSGNNIGCNEYNWATGSANVWEMAAVSVHSNGTEIAYAFLNGGMSSSSHSYGQPIETSKGVFTFGTWSSGYLYTGLLSNVQVYDTALNANELQYLYNEGIGGAPISLSHLVAWWPLNGDTKDYSGNGYDGTATHMTFNGSWTSGYSFP